MFKHKCSVCHRIFETEWRRNYFCENCRKIYNRKYYEKEKAEGRETDKVIEKTFN